MSEEKIKTVDELKEIVSRLRSEGKSVVLSNGCFDILHVGHIRYLKGAKEEGDILITALNSDASSAALKGEGRPLMPLSERMEIISSLETVDFVTSFEETDVVNILLTLKPDVHAKGTDYTIDTVPERETVKEYGGRIAIVGDNKDHSSSDMIEKINGTD